MNNLFNRRLRDAELSCNTFVFQLNIGGGGRLPSVPFELIDDFMRYFHNLSKEKVLLLVCHLLADDNRRCAARRNGALGAPKPL